MNIGTESHVSQNQQLSLTPKMIEELKILQMSYIDLLQFVNTQLTENPVLETEDDDNDFELPIDEMKEEESCEAGLNNEARKKDYTEFLNSTITLRQHLILQARELRIGKEIRKIVFYLIETINAEGYLGTSIGETSRYLSVSLEKVKKALKIIQNLEPAGVGARSIKECILLQLSKGGQLNSNIKTIIMDYLHLLAEKKFRSISEKLGISLEQIEDIYQKIRSTDPKPGLRFTGNTKEAYIQPELVVKSFDGKYIVLFSNDIALNLKVSEHYKMLLRNSESPGEAKKYIKQKVSKAIEVINAIEERKRTILNVAACIVEFQEEFLKKGHMYLRPLTLKTVADIVGLHESTISRTVNEKYIETPRGIFELKYFFSSHIDNITGSGISSNAIKKAIKDAIQVETKDKPLSDEQLKQLLEDKGIKVARRTIAKYRGELSILPAKMRKQ